MADLRRGERGGWGVSGSPPTSGLVPPQEAASPRGEESGGGNRSRSGGAEVRFGGAGMAVLRVAPRGKMAPCGRARSHLLW